MNDQNSSTNQYAISNRKNTSRLRNWTLAWLVTSALAVFGPKLIWDFDSLLTILGVIINLAVGFGMIWANKQHLRGLDELQQKIFLEAGALSLGVGLVCGLAYAVLEDIRLINFEPEIAHVVILMCLTFLAGMVNGHRKYR